MSESSAEWRAATGHQTIAPPNHQNTETSFPSETEIYILPDGRVIVADMPAELSALVERVGASVEAAAPSQENHDQHD